MAEIDIRDQLAALLKEIRAQEAKLEVISTCLGEITAKPVTALDASSPTPTASMVSSVDIHGAAPPSSGHSSVPIRTSELILDVSEVPAPTCCEREQDILFQIAGVTTVEMLGEGVPESVPMSAAPQGSSSSVSISKESLGAEHSACTGFITSAPATCSSGCLPQQPMAAPVQVGSSSSILTKYGLDTTPATWATTTFVASESLVKSISNTSTSDSAPPFTREDAQEMLEPMSKLFGKSEDSVSSRPPRRPPEFEAASDQNCIREPLPRPWPFLACVIGPVYRESCSPSEERAPFSNWSMLNGTRSTSHGYIIGIVLCSPSGVYCLDDVLLFLEYWGSASSDRVQSARTYHTIVWLPCSTISGLHLLVMVSILELKLLSHGSAPFTLLEILLDRGKFAALSESVAGLLSTVDWHLLDFPYRSAVTVCSYWSGYLITDMISIWPFLLSFGYTTLHHLLSKRYDGWECLIFNGTTSFSCMNAGVLFTSWICVAEQTLITLHKMRPPVQRISPKSLLRETYERYCCFAIATLNLRSIISLSDGGSPSDANVVLLSFCGKTHQIGFLLHGGTRADLSSRVSCKFVLPVQMQMLWSPRVHAFVLPVGKCCRDWLFSHAAIGRGALLILTQTDVLKCMDLWWFTTAILTEIMSICRVGCFVQMDVSCLVQPDLLLTHAYQLSSGGWEKLVRIAHKYCVTVPCAITRNDPMVDWHNSKHIQGPSIGVMHTVWESFSWSKLICLLNSVITMCAILVRFLIGNDARKKSGISNEDIGSLAVAAGIATGMSPGTKVNYRFETIIRRVICACRPSVALCPASGTIAKTASSSEIVLGKELYAPWDPGGGILQAINDGGLRASQMLRRGECHGPCGRPSRVAWAIARRDLYLKKTWTEDPGNSQTSQGPLLKEDRGRTDGHERTGTWTEDPGKGGRPLSLIPLASPSQSP